MTLSYFEERTQKAGAKYGIALNTLCPAMEDLLLAIRTSGFFRTYTDHSLRHCDQMFLILTWLLPERVKEALTDVECTLLVLAVYLHDLGMLATQEEFGSRQANEEFERYRERYTQAFDCASPLSADHPTLDHFIFEEYIRHTHAERIFDWLTSDRPELPQAKSLRGILFHTSAAFRHHLGTICKSHHLDNLHDKSLYPVDCRFGNDSTDRANIQFIAICLRLADILHMSNDRTPSIQFQLISPRNPISAREWAKQLDVSGIGLSITDSSDVLIHAVCKNPQVYFYIKDFIGVCDEELNRCRAWLEGNPSSVLDRYHLSVRHVSDAGLQPHGFIAERFELQLDHRRIVELLMGHSLYGDMKVAIRELVQNALDAVRVRQLEDASVKPSIAIRLSEDETLLEITDNGIGMDLDVIRNHFLKIGDSYYRSPAFRRRCPSYTPISQFGIGFLTSFMIADRVTVITRTAAKSGATLVLQLEDIYDLFTVREVPKTHGEGRSVTNGGTSVILHLRKDVDLRDLVEDVKRWLVFLEFPITVKLGSDESVEVWGIRGTTANEIAADIAQRAKEDATEYFPIHINRDGVNVIVLWPGGKLGDTAVLDPAGQYLLPLTARFRRWEYGDPARRMRQKNEGLVRKVANAGIFLADEIPGLKILERLRIHYVVDCRDELRFTPLVSRAGIAVDGSSIKILDLFIEGLAGFLADNLSELLNTGVSKYFCSYYVASAFEQLFNREQMENDKEKILSGLMAVRYACRVPFLLFKNNSEIVLRSWMQHDNKPIVVGRNVYNGLLRSVAFGLVDFPLPTEVIESLPENFLLSMGAENVIFPMFFLSQYKPSVVHYHEPSRGVFVKWETNVETKSFGGFWLLEFPSELSDVVGIEFSMASCLNSSHPAVKFVLKLAGQAEGRLPTGGQRSGDKQDDPEQRIVRTLLDLTRHPERDGMYDRDELRGTVRDRFARIAGLSDATIPDALIDSFIEARVIRDDLWSFRL